MLGGSFLEVLILFEQWAVQRLFSEKVTRLHVRPNRSISVSSVLVSEGIRNKAGMSVQQSGQRVGQAYWRFGRFLPCRVGAHMSILRHVGWEHCSHGFTSRPLESCHHQRLKAVCGILGCPAGAAAELLDGTPKLRYCTTSFTNRFPPLVLLRLGDGVGKKGAVAFKDLMDGRSNVGKRGPANKEDTSWYFSSR